MRRKKLLAAHWRDPVAKKRTVGWLLCRCCSGALLFAMVGDADVLHVVIPGGHYTPVPRVCLDETLRPSPRSRSERERAAACPGAAAVPLVEQGAPIE